MKKAEQTAHEDKRQTSMINKTRHAQTETQEIQADKIAQTTQHTCLVLFCLVLSRLVSFRLVLSCLACEQARFASKTDNTQADGTSTRTIDTALQSSTNRIRVRFMVMVMVMAMVMVMFMVDRQRRVFC